MEANKEGNSCLLSGGAPDSHCSMSGADLLPNLAQPTVATPGSWRTGHCPVHTGQSGAPKIETLILISFCFSNPFSF